MQGGKLVMFLRSCHAHVDVEGSRSAPRLPGLGLDSQTVSLLLVQSFHTDSYQTVQFSISANSIQAPIKIKKDFDFRGCPNTIN